ncbi:MAG: TfoX/Sxy family protein [Betaproteobacteria bacterium]|nr:TfoX/Sxy family protein [Betaproteobacteria bacterium]
MAAPYLERLATMLREVGPKTSCGVRLQCKHFFSGAALYANGTICASLTPVGFAVKLSQESRAGLLRERQGKPLRYFERGPIKKEYVVLSAATLSEPEAIRVLLQESIRYATRSKQSRPTRP